MLNLKLKDKIKKSVGDSDKYHKSKKKQKINLILCNKIFNLKLIIHFLKRINKIGDIL